MYDRTYDQNTITTTIYDNILSVKCMVFIVLLVSSKFFFNPFKQK